MHYYQFNISDYKSHTEHLSDLEDLAYRRMLDWCYLHETPLPKEKRDIARLIRMRSHSDSIAIVLREFFDKDKDGRYINKRVFLEINKVSLKSSKARESAKARWDKEKKDANALRSECDSNATQDTLPETQDTDKKKKHTDADFSLANKMFTMLDDLNIGVKKPNLEKWAGEIRLIRERDDRTIEEITEVFTWANNNEFWKGNIRSPAKLRKQWPALVSQMKTVTARKFTSERELVAIGLDKSIECPPGMSNSEYAQKVKKELGIE